MTSAGGGREDPTRFAVLSILADQPAHGYAVHRILEERFGDLLEPNYGRVYQVLAALERAGWIAGNERRTGRRPARRVYAVERRGDEALSTWLRAGPPRGEILSADFLVRLAVARSRGLDVLPGLDAEVERARVALDCAGGRLPSDEGIGPGDPVPALLALSRRLRAAADLRALEAARAWFCPAAGPRGAVPASAPPAHRAPGRGSERVRGATASRPGRAG